MDEVFDFEQFTAPASTGLRIFAEQASPLGGSAHPLALAMRGYLALMDLAFSASDLVLLQTTVPVVAIDGWVCSRLRTC